MLTVHTSDSFFTWIFASFSVIGALLPSLRLYQYSEMVFKNQIQMWTSAVNVLLSQRFAVTFVWTIPNRITNQKKKHLLSS